MKAQGNGEVATCIANLLRIVRGEVPFERLKGIDPKLIDQPAEIAAPLLTADAQWVIETYEPRADITKISVTAELAKAGYFKLNVE